MIVRLGSSLALIICAGMVPVGLAAGTTQRVSIATGGIQGNGSSSNQALSPNGQFIAFNSDASNLVPGDTNEVSDVFVRDRQARTTRRVSVRSNGAQSNLSSFRLLAIFGDRPDGVAILVG
jgi:hypothetical protein